MLLLFKGPYRTVAQLVIGIVLLVIGLLTHSTIVDIIGGALIVWGLYTAITGRRTGRGTDA